MRYNLPGPFRMLRFGVPILFLGICLVGCSDGQTVPLVVTDGGNALIGDAVMAQSADAKVMAEDASPQDAGTATAENADALAPVPQDLGPVSRRCDAMDVLFVVDNSESMSEEQANLAQNFPRFVEVLNSFSEEPLDYRIGVTTTAFDERGLLNLGLVSPAEEGALLQTAPMERPWLERGDPDLIDTFAKLATVGTQGSAMEQPLRAAVSALTDRAVPGGPNASFLRDDALLAIIVVTDEDDFSSDDQATLMPLKEILADLDRIKRLRDRWSVAVLAGDEVPQCKSDFGSAGFASRLLDFVEEAGENAAFGSICTGDLAAPLEKTFELFQQACLHFPLVI